MESRGYVGSSAVPPPKTRLLDFSASRWPRHAHTASAAVMLHSVASVRGIPGCATAAVAVARLAPRPSVLHCKLHAFASVRSGGLMDAP